MEKSEKSGQQAEWDAIKAEMATGAPAEKLPAQEAEPVAEPAQVAADPAAAAAPAASPASAPVPSTEDRLRVALERLDKIEGRQRNVEGHIGGLTRTSNEVKATLAAAKAAASTTETAPTDKQIAKAIDDPADWNALKEEFPEWSSATEKFVDARIARIAGPQAVDPKAIERIVAEQVAGATAAVRESTAKDALDVTFPGWQEDVTTDSFKAWIAAQTPQVNEWAASSKVGDAARLLKLWEQSKAPTAQATDDSAKAARILEDRQQRLAASAAAPRGVKPAATKSPDQMTMPELWAYEKRLLEKKQRRPYG